MRNLFFLIISLFLLSSCHWHSVKGDGHVVTDERSVSDFRNVKLRGFMNVYLTQEATTKVTIEGEENIIQHIRTYKENNNLIISTESGWRLRNTKPVNVYVSAPMLEEIGISGSGDIIGKTKLTSDRRLEFSIAGSGNINTDVDAPEVKVDIGGSGNSEVKGRTKDLSIEIAGSGKAQAKELMSENANVNIAGSGNAYVYASSKLDVRVAGSGDVYYLGKPQITSHIAGSGTVKALE